MGFFSNILKGLRKTKDAIAKKLSELFKRGVGKDFYDEMEEILISADISYSAASKIVEDLKKVVKEEKIKDEEYVKELLRRIMQKHLEEVEPLEIAYPAIIMIVGVNGVGKTTSIGKLANYFIKQKKSVIIAAADTFRAAASDQLTVWAERAGVRVIKQTEGIDPAAIVFDAVKSAKAKNTDVLIVDTAGRLHNKDNLMEELKKMNRVIEREYPEANHYNMIVLDATTGQNATNQVKYFNDAVGLDGIILTKLDGTAKGGVVLSIADEYEIPVKFIGIGEKIDDLEDFNAEEFSNAIV